MTFCPPLRRWVASAVLATTALGSTSVLAQQLDWCTKLLQPALVQAAAAAQDKKKPKSFSAAFRVSEQFSLEPLAGCPAPPYGLRGSVTGAGASARMGPMGLASENCATGAPDGTPAFLGSDVRLTAATGEVLHARYCGLAVPQAPGSTQNTLSGLFVVVGITHPGQAAPAPALGYGTISGFETLTYVPGTQMPYQGYGTIVLDGVLGY